MHLAGIRVLWRQSDTMALYGIPYDMRPGQQPADLTRGSPTLPPGTYGAKPRAPGPRDDWLYLGSPGWWGSLSRGDQSAIVAWLATLEPGIVPTGPNEWSPVRYRLACSACGAHVPDMPASEQAREHPAWLCIECSHVKASHAWRDDDSEPGETG